MGIEGLVSTLIAGMATLVGVAVASVASSDVIRKLLRRVFKVPEQPEKPYSERLAELTAGLTKASGEVDAVLAELSQVSLSREAAVQRLETDLATLETREKELKEKIETLEETPLPVAEHFAQLLKSGERRGARRDYMLFGAGVVVTTAIAIIIQAVGG